MECENCGLVNVGSNIRCYNCGNLIVHSQEVPKFSKPINNHLIKLIIAAILFTPIGVIPLIYSIIVNVKIDDGDLPAAENNK